MNASILIKKKRDGFSLSNAEWKFLLEGYIKNEIPDYQISALLMATYFRSMSNDEMFSFTDLMLNSGSVLNLSNINGIKVDKHSTGGVGDKISLLLAPIVAACGVFVPMISGRGLGHTGGTLDKLEAIPGFRTNLSIEEYKNVLEKVGVVLIGQTSEIAPADKKLYSLRDVTATVECIPLIAGSIMSKKLAEGMDALVLDVKVGSGAFMKNYDDAKLLAQTLVAVGKKYNKKTIAFLTNMNEPIGNMIGNWFEIVESVLCLKGKIVPDVLELTLTLGGMMVFLGGKAKNFEEGKLLCQNVIDNGKAYQKFLEIVEAQGGDVNSIENLNEYPKSKFSAMVTANGDGFISKIESLEIGYASLLLGAGRATIEDKIDPKAGIILMKKVGDKVIKGEYIATIFTDKENILEEVKIKIQNAYTVSVSPPEKEKLILEIIE
ncbi:MAG: thymidine phosphorylase [Bacteroidota bacterium]